MNQLSSSFLESLLYESEGDSLDFKREQYKFDGASKDEKSELLKDILAFVNSWRRTTAYIIIGVDENKGGRGEIVGISNDLEDAKLQQFVNSKTNKPVTFAYRTLSVENKLIGIIEIPVHERPIYLVSTFGRLEKEKIYVRRGSSTAVAAPDEIAKMGLASSTLSPPKLSLEWADLGDRRVLPSPCALKSVILEPRLPDDTFDQTRARSGYTVIHSYNDPDYSKKLIEFTCSSHMFRELGFRLHNASETVARRVRFVGHIENQRDFVLLDWEDRPLRPYRNTMLGLHRNIRPIAEQIRRDPDPCVKVYKSYTEVTIEFGDVRPRDEIWSTTPILLGARDEGTMILDGELRGDNLPNPIPTKLEASLQVDVRPMEIEDVEWSLEVDDQE